MAYTVSFIAKTVFGNERTNVMKVTADGAEANLDCGVSYVDGFSLGAVTLTSALIKLHPNEDSSGSASNGKVGVSGAASGDIFFLTVYGH